ncbi:MAG: hypothetical protein WBO94_08490, partial [Nitrospira sp.]
MNIWLPGLIPAFVLGIAAGVVFGSVAPSHADHELPKPPPLWSPLDDIERLALIEVPDGMVPVPAGSF